MYSINPKDKYHLFRNTRNFCSAPWNLVFVDVDGSIKTCVNGQDYIGNLQHNSIEEIINNATRREIKKNILDDTVCNNCQQCAKLENSGVNGKNYNFIRNHYNETARDIDIDYLDVDKFVLGALDLHWSSLCDLKCVTCRPKSSSSIAIEQGLPVQHLPTQHAMKFIDWVDQNQSTLKEIYLSGGEPTMIKYNAKLLERINKRDDLLIRVNSNLMWDFDNSVIAEIVKFPRVLFTCSADAVGKRFEYIRRGADWSRFESRLEWLLSQSNVSVRINSVFSVLNGSILTDVIDYYQQRFNISDFTVNQCMMGHFQLRCRNLPEAVKQQALAKINIAIQGRYSHDLNLVGQLKNCVAELQQPSSESYVEYLDRIDHIADTDWRSIFRELQ